MPFYERQPYIQPLHQLVAEILEGQIRVPRFQRPGTESTWTPEQRGQLLDSIYRGFPVGTILLWATSEPISTLDEVGGFEIPPWEGQPTPRLLLDGHQRLSTLVQILGPAVTSERKRKGQTFTEQSHRDEQWVFELDVPDDTPSRDRFVLLKPQQQPTTTQLPLDRALDLAALNKWVRDVQLSDTLTSTADELRTRLREYQMPVGVLAADSLTEATESFKRVNSSGTPMSDYHMAVALAYDEGADPRDEFELFRDETLQQIGWSTISDQDLLRVFAGRVGQNPAKMDISKLAASLRIERSNVPDLLDGCRRASEILDTFGIHGPNALPYGYQFTLLSVVLGEALEWPLQPPQTDAIRRWFWLTTYGEVFSGVKSTVYSRARTALESMMAGGGYEAMVRDTSSQVSAPRRFDYRSARAKASALAMARMQDQGQCDGAAHRALAVGGAASLQTLLPRGRRSEWSHLAIVHDGATIADLRSALYEWSMGGGPNTKGLSLGIPEAASGSVEELLRARADAILASERQLIESLGLDWVPPETASS